MEFDPTLRMPRQNFVRLCESAIGATTSNERVSLTYLLNVMRDGHLNASFHDAAAINVQFCDTILITVLQLLIYHYCSGTWFSVPLQKMTTPQPWHACSCGELNSNSVKLSDSCFYLKYIKYIGTQSFSKLGKAAPIWIRSFVCAIHDIG